MSYKTNSPVKKIWLPMSYNFLMAKVTGTPITYDSFVEIYKKEYGIDFNDIIIRKSNNIYLIGDVSTYTINSHDYGVPDNLVCHNPLLKESDTDYLLGWIFFNNQGGLSEGFGIHFDTSGDTTMVFATEI